MTVPTRVPLSDTDDAAAAAAVAVAVARTRFRLPCDYPPPPPPSYGSPTGNPQTTASLLCIIYMDFDNIMPDNQIT